MEQNVKKINVDKKMLFDAAVVTPQIRVQIIQKCYENYGQKAQIEKCIEKITQSMAYVGTEQFYHFYMTQQQ